MNRTNQRQYFNPSMNQDSTFSLRGSIQPNQTLRSELTSRNMNPIIPIDVNDIHLKNIKKAQSFEFNSNNYVNNNQNIQHQSYLPPKPHQNVNSHHGYQSTPNSPYQYKMSFQDATKSPQLYLQRQSYN